MILKVLGLSVAAHAARPVSDATIERIPPAAFVTWKRFDILIKWAYATFVLASNPSRNVTPFVSSVYTEHERVWNGFEEGCAKQAPRAMRKMIDESHPNCSLKHGAATFVSRFNVLLESMRQDGFLDQGAIAACAADAATLSAVGASHRIASALALREPTIPVHLHSDSTCAAGTKWDAAMFARMGYDQVYSDWVVTQAILADPSLHVVHIWPMALANARAASASAAEAPEAALALVREVLATSLCSTEDGYLYERRVDLSAVATLRYMRHSYGDTPWLKTKRSYAWAPGLPLTLFVLHSNATLLRACKAELRAKLAPRARNGWALKSVAHGTDTHEEASKWRLPQHTSYSFCTLPPSHAFWLWNLHSLACRIVVSRGTPAL